MGLKLRDGLRIGPAGNSDSFYAQGHKHTFEAGKWVSDLGLNAFEYSFGRGVSASAPTLQKIGEQMTKYNVQVSAHAPYYTNFANANPEMVEKTFGYIRQSIEAVRLMGGNRVVVHPGSLGGMSRESAMSLATKNISLMVEYFESLDFGDYLVCIETMGKLKQIGTLEEVLIMVKPFANLTPCIDFGHVNCYTLGGLKTKGDYRRLIDLTFDELGEERARNIHIHFSKIMFGKSGEIKHLNFDDETFGPDYLPLAELIEEYKMTPVIICESNGKMAEDAVLMKNCHLKKK